MTQFARRQVLGALAATPLTGLSLAAVLADPNLAKAAAAGLEVVTVTTAGGKGVSGALALPAKTPAASIVLIHEWWGLNDQIKSVAAELAKEGYLALAVDLYGGNMATTSDAARALMQAVDPAEAHDTLTSWDAWLGKRADTTDKMGTIGWCFGGGWSLSASIAAPVDATVIYYGRVNHPPANLKKLKGPVLGHFATRDQWINQDMVGGFENAMGAAHKDLTSHWYEADHAFANPSGGRYDAEDAKLAWKRTLEFFRANL